MAKATAQPDFSSLLVSLNDTKSQIKNNALYQVLYQLLQRVSVSRDLIVNDIAGSADKNRTYLTVNDETFNLPDSSQLIAGTNITFTIAPNKLTINAAGAGPTSKYYDAPLSDGDTSAADLIFANGECVIVQVPV